MSDQPINSTPVQPSPVPTGTIDITGLVATIKSVWIRWATSYVMGLAVAAFPPLGFIIINPIVEFFVNKIAAAIADSAEMGAFFLNTALRKGSQARDFIEAVDAKQSLPPTATDEEYENAEKQEMAAFRNFVLVTN